ncbi:hypothetical protein IV203_000686 [Nitzschia inconspicua]|uniref:Uncharacterized protein n=1 Tax=Nitzschia inconspicua TaxID=303405 RepID=A0A9K3L5A6_9STRA|nr:hypothetical protein IV203_000686 [Nitzschia inconspicua]
MVSFHTHSPSNSSSYIVSLLTHHLQNGNNNSNYRLSLAAVLLLLASVALNNLGTTVSLVESALAKWIPHIFVPFYTLTVIFYLSIRWFHDGTLKRQESQASVIQRQPPTTAPLGAPPSQITAGPPPPIDLSGCYKLTENHNFEALLQAQGVPWFLVSAANKARPIHRITQDSTYIKIKIEGIIESETMYIVGGPPVETIIRGRLFRDQVTYMKLSDSLLDQENKENGGNTKSGDSASRIVGIQTHKRAIDDGYTILVQRRLSDDKSQIILTSRVQFDDDARADVQSKQIFQRSE